MDNEYANLNIRQGRGLLEGVCDCVRKADYEYESDYNGYIFRLNGQNYAVWENPSDGYRSYCGIEATKRRCTNMFPPQEIFVLLYDEHENKGLVLYNLDDGSLILKIGTDNYDDYYPCAVMEWHPENLPINKL